MQVSEHIAKKGDFSQRTFPNKDNIFVDKTQDGNIQIGKMVGNNNVLLVPFDIMSVDKPYPNKDKSEENGRPKPVQHSPVFLKPPDLDGNGEKRQE